MSDSGISNDRPSGLSATHNDAALSRVMARAEATGTVNETLATTTKAAAVTARMQECFSRNRDTWIRREYGDMLKKQTGAPSLHPTGVAIDRVSHLQRAATYKVDMRQTARLRNVEAIRDRMIDRLHGKEPQHGQQRDR